MTSHELHQNLASILGELAHGSPPDAAFVLNPGDPGLLAALDGLSAADASLSHDGGGTIAAHADHVRYALSLMNRWAAGEANPFADADWTAAWKRGTISDDEWSELRQALRTEVERWLGNLREPRSVAGTAAVGMIGSVVHVAYHLGAIRQIVPATRGPRAGTSP